MTGLRFETDENGNWKPNVWIPCERCGEACGFATADEESALEFRTNPIVTLLCQACGVTLEAESYTKDAA